MTEPAQKMSVRIPGVDGGGDQVFEAENAQDLIEKLRVAQENATGKIRELNQQVQQTQSLAADYQTQLAQRQQPTKGDDSKFDPQYYYSQAYTDPLAALKYGLEHLLGTPIEEFKADYDQTRTGAMIGWQQAVNGAFVARHPELLQVPQEDDLVNGKVISEILTERNWAYSVDNLEAAYQVAKASGKLKLPPPENQQEPNVTLPKPPVTIGSPSAPVSGEAEEEKFLRTGSLEEVREYLNKKFAGQSPFVPIAQ